MKSRLGLKLLLCALSSQIQEVCLTALLFLSQGATPRADWEKLAIHLARLL